MEDSAAFHLVNKNALSFSAQSTAQHMSSPYGTPTIVSITTLEERKQILPPFQMPQKCTFHSTRKDALSPTVLPVV